MRFAIVNLGCKVNRVESDSFAALLLNSGAEESSVEHADAVVVNTCAVTGEAEKKTRKAVRGVLRENAYATVFVTGCSAALRPQVFTEMSERVRVVPKADLPGEIKRLAASSTEPKSCSGQDGTIGFADDGTLLRIGQSFPTRVGVKVQDGCNSACTYCIVHVARGPAVSMPFERIVAECVHYARAGVKEIVLTGINLGSYCDNSERRPRTLAHLLSELLESTRRYASSDEPPCRFRISSVEPKDVDEGLIEILAASGGRVCRHLHLPLQSGSSNVLREMARPYDADYYIDLVSILRKRVPQLSLSTDIIVAFPGETDEDFNATLSVAKECAFSKIHVFPYSKREGTPAAERVDQVPGIQAAARAKQLRHLAKQLRAADYRARTGSCERVLVEQYGRGMTESYYEITVPSNLPVGSLPLLPLPANT